jgi:SWI/SNF-related matrix-associated actin-dependent regulator 1 of chromatin subfamily A
MVGRARGKDSCHPFWERCGRDNSWHITISCGVVQLFRQNGALHTPVPPLCVCLENYNGFLYVPQELAKKFSIVVVDESHYLKDPSAKRTKAAMPILKESKRCVLLTGTPALNRPKEIFTQLSAVVPKAQLKLKDFGERYCTGNRFDKYGGAKNLEELHALLRNSVMIRRLKVDVLAELPKKRRQQIYLGLDAASRKKLDALKQQLQEAKSAIHQLVAQSIASNRGNVVNVGAEQRSVVMEVYKKTADIKVKCVQDYIDTLLDGDQKFLVFAHHTVLLDAVEHSCNRKKGCKYIRIDGSTPASSRAGLVQSFQTDDSVRVAILSIKAAGVGLTMTAASTVVFAEMTWTPGEIIQAEDRAHRIGQASSVNVYFLHIKDSIDDVIWNTIQSKLENLGQTLDGADQNLHLSQTSRVMPERGQSSLDKYLTQSQPS